MTNEEDSAALALGDVFHLADGFFLELGVADGKDLIHDKNLGFEESGDSKTQTDSHTGRITFDGSVNILLTTGEIHYLIQLRLYLLLGHAEYGAVHEDILPAGHLTMEAGADLQEGGDTSARLDSTDRGAGDLAEQLEECGFAGAILADNAHNIPLFDLEVNVPQRPDIIRSGLGRPVIDIANLQIGVLLAKDTGDPPAVDIMRESAGTDKTQSILLADMIKFYSCCHISMYCHLRKYIIRMQIYNFFLEYANKKRHGGYFTCAGTMRDMAGNYSLTRERLGFNYFFLHENG